MKTALLLILFFSGLFTQRALSQDTTRLIYKNWNPVVAEFNRRTDLISALYQAAKNGEEKTVNQLRSVKELSNDFYKYVNSWKDVDTIYLSSVSEKNKNLSLDLEKALQMVDHDPKLKKNQQVTALIGHIAFMKTRVIQDCKRYNEACIELKRAQLQFVYQ